MLERINHIDSQNQDNLSDKVSRELSIMAAVPENAWAGLKARAADAWEHKAQTGAEIAGSVALGVGLAMAVRNPETVPFTRFVPLVASAFVVGDVAKRVGNPMLETWNDPLSLDRNKSQVGHNLGAMAFDYTLMGTAGATGAKFAPGFVSGLADVIAGSKSGLRLSQAADGFGSASAPGDRILALNAPKPLSGAENPGKFDLTELKAKWPEAIGNNAGGHFQTNFARADFANPSSVLQLKDLAYTTAVGLPAGAQLGIALAAINGSLKANNNERVDEDTQKVVSAMHFQGAIRKSEINGEQSFSRAYLDEESISRFSAKDSKAWKSLLKNSDKH